MLGRLLPIPKFERHEMFHVRDIRELYVREEVVCDADRYVYMQGLVAWSPIRAFHAGPGPKHDTGAWPSPGEYVSKRGIAVVVTLMTPN